MMRPLVISFPVIDAPPNRQGLKGRVILLRMTPIAPALPWLAPTMCRVEGMHENGAMNAFTIPLEVWNTAVRKPATFIQTDDRLAPVGNINERKVIP